MEGTLDVALLPPFAADREAIAAGYRYCLQLAATHYENFTVGSRLLPRRLRAPIAAVYAFARIADDIADEGNRPAAERLAALAAWEAELEACYAGRATHPAFAALGDTARRFELPIEPFRRLVDAFRQDVEFHLFSTFADLRDYCSRSADPVGHLVLGLFGYHDAHRRALADGICTGLQLANFWQDLAVDAGHGRVYLPLDELERFGCTVDDVHGGRVTEPLRALLRGEVARARAFLRDGLALADAVDRRLAREVRLFGWGGLAILDAIAARDYDVFSARPALSRTHKGLLVLRALAGASTPPDPGRRGGVSRPHPGGHHLSTPEARLPVSGHAAVRDAYAYCREITRLSSSNFYHAFRLLPAERRSALCAVYAFCRFVDDIADDAGRRQPAELLARWRDELERVYGGEPTHPIGRALADAVRRYPIPPEYFLDLIRGVELDLSRKRYATFAELHEYCYLVASTVGLMCIEVFGYRHEGARQYAVDLGVAFQLTNILRDVREDGERGRIYLPLDDLRRFDLGEADLLAGRYTPRIGTLLAFEAGRARSYYRSAVGALAAADHAALAPAEAMRLIYGRLLDRMEARGFDVFGPKVTVPSHEKVALALFAWGRAKLARR